MLALLSRASRTWVAIVALVALTGLALPAAPAAASPGLATTDLSTLTPTDLANELAGAGVTVSNVTYTGANVAGGTFTGGTGIIGFESGVILSTGNIANVIGPNVSNGISTDNGLGGDADLTALSGGATYDAAVLEFDFVPQGSVVTFQYVFASDEYNEYVFEFNDVFAFFVNGTNCATVSGPNGPEPVSINTINNGNPYGNTPNSHPELFINNEIATRTTALDTEMDGLTVVMTCDAAVNPGVTNHMKLAIADALDHSLDTVVFLRAGSFTLPSPTPTQTSAAPPVNLTATPSPTRTPVATATLPPTSTATAVPPTAIPTSPPAGGQAGTGIRPPSTGSGGQGDGAPVAPFAGLAAAIGVALIGAVAFRLRRKM